jgi:hypothetical protein
VAAGAAATTDPVVFTGTATGVSHTTGAGFQVVPAVFAYQDSSHLVIDRLESGDSSAIVVDLARGGIISQATLNGTSYLASKDLSRGVQVDLFTGDAQYDDCGGCSIPRAFNPAQGGDSHGHTSAISGPVAGATDISLSVRPLEWYPDNKRYASPSSALPSDVSIDQSISPVPGESRAFKLHYRITHTGLDSHSGAMQWLPAVFAQKDFNRLVRYDGASPWTNGATTTTTPVADAATAKFIAAERWAAWTNAASDGITLYVPGDYAAFQAKAVGGTSGETGTGYNRLSPNGYLDLKPGEVIVVDAYLVLGDVAQARATIGRIHSSITAADPYDPQGFLDVPVSQATVKGTVPVSGWAIDNRGVAQVQILVDGASVGSASYGSPRADLASAYPGVNTNAGFSMSLNTSTIADGLHVMTARATDSAGNAITVAPHLINVANGANLAPPNVTVTVGAEETVYTYSQLCPAASGDIYDFPVRFTHAADGSIIMTSTNGPKNYLSFGSTIDNTVRNCTPVLTGPQNPKPDNFDNWYWINAIYREGTTIHALIHNEYHDPVNPPCKTGDLSPANPCWYNTLSYASSTDGGHTFTTPTPPNQLIAAPPLKWDPAASGFYGYLNPTNMILAKDGFYYIAFNAIPGDVGQTVSAGPCLMRTKTLGDPTSWRAYDGTGFTIAMRSPYDPQSRLQPCAYLRFGSNAYMGGVSYLAYNSYLESYMLLGARPSAGVCDVDFSLSKDLVHWTTPQTLKTDYLTQADCYVPGAGGKAGSASYPSLVDPTDTSVNFEMPGQSPYLYMVRWRSNNERERDIVRFKLTFTIVP